MATAYPACMLTRRSVTPNADAIREGSSPAPRSASTSRSVDVSVGGGYSGSLLRDAHASTSFSRRWAVRGGSRLSPRASRQAVSARSLLTSVGGQRTRRPGGHGRVEQLVVGDGHGQDPRRRRPLLDLTGDIPGIHLVDVGVDDQHVRHDLENSLDRIGAGVDPPDHVDIGFGAVRVADQIDMGRQIIEPRRATWCREQHRDEILRTSVG